MNNLLGLKSEDLDLIISILKEEVDISEVIVYGSRAKGNYKNGSDIDITLKGENLNSKKLFYLEDKLDDLLLPYKFDISIYKNIDNKDLIDHIDRIGVSIYQKSLSSH